MPPKNRRRLKAREFDALTRRLDMTDRTVQLARRVMVGGETHRSVAGDAGVTRPAVSQHVARVWQAYLDGIEDNLPDAYQRVTAILTHEQAGIVAAWHVANCKKRTQA